MRRRKLEPEVPDREYRSQLSSQLHLTNNYSILSKYSASRNGYFKDKYLEHFVDTELKPKIRRRTPLVNRGYAARMMAVQWAVYRQTSVQCLVILGAGYDMLSLRYTKEFKCHCIEIDFPEVIETKKKYLIERFNIQEVDILQQSESVVYFPKFKLHLIGCDLRYSSMEFIPSFAMGNIPPTERRLIAVLNEVCLCYLEPCEVEQILNNLIRTFTLNGATVITYIGYEPVRSREREPFAELMKEHFSSIDFALKHFPTSTELEDFFKNKLEFQHFSLTSMHHMYYKTLSEWREKINRNSEEPFDEFEEMDLYLSQYALVVAAIDLQRTRSNLTECFVPESSITNIATDESCTRIGSQMSLRQSRERVHGEMNKCVMRFGHASCLLSDKPGDQSILVNGGFGLTATSDVMPKRSQHKRLADWFILHRDSKSGWQAQLLEPDGELGFQPGRMHAQLCYMGHKSVLINDGRQSPRPKEYSASTYMAYVDEDKSLLRLMSSFKYNEVRWRHQTRPIPEGRWSGAFIQVGGHVSYPPGQRPEYTSNVTVIYFERGAIHSGYLFMNDEDDEGNDYLYARHSFGMDFMDANTFLVFGGLHSNTNLPVNSKHGAVTLDMRIEPFSSPSVTILNYSTPYYDNQVHFINDHQFVNMGGVSTLTGEPNNYIELFDLRKTNQKEPIFREPLQPIMEDPGKAERRLFPTKQTSVNFKESSEIVTIGGGGNYFTFGTHFNRCALVYNYADLRCGIVGGDTQTVKEPTAPGRA